MGAIRWDGVGQTCVWVAPVRLARSIPVTRQVTAQPGASFTAENAEFAEVSTDFSAFSATSAVRSKKT